MHLDESNFTLIGTIATISLAGPPVAACDASGRAEPSRTQRFPVAGDDSDGPIKGFGAQFRDRQRREDRPPADARTRSWSRCHR